MASYNETKVDLSQNNSYVQGNNSKEKFPPEEKSSLLDLSNATATDTNATVTSHEDTTAALLTHGDLNNTTASFDNSTASKAGDSDSLLKESSAGSELLSSRG